MKSFKGKYRVKVAVAQDLLAMEVTGHAENPPGEGSPAACVPVLAFSLLCMEAVADKKDLKWVSEPEYIGISISGRTARDAYVQGAFNIVVATLAGIAQTYDEDVELTIAR